MSGAQCEPPGHNFRDGEQICNCRNAMRPKPPDKTPAEIMAWLAGLVCGACGGQGGAQVAVTAPDGEHLGSEPEGCVACGATGRMLWRLVAGQHHGIRFQPPRDGKEARYECEYCQRASQDIAEVRRLEVEDCPSRPLRVRRPTLEILIDTGLDLGFASVFTPEAWDVFLPDRWITVRSGRKIDDLLRSLVALVERRQLHGCEAQDAAPAS